MTKAVTCTAAMQMVEQGKLSLDEPIGDVLPELDRHGSSPASTRPASRSTARPARPSRCAIC